MSLRQIPETSSSVIAYDRVFRSDEGDRNWRGYARSQESRLSKRVQIAAATTPTNHELNPITLIDAMALKPRDSSTMHEMTKRIKASKAKSTSVVIAPPARSIPSVCSVGEEQAQSSPVCMLHSKRTPWLPAMVWLRVLGIMATIHAGSLYIWVVQDSYFLCNCFVSVMKHFWKGPELG